jgi:hypothetical protein
MKILEPSLGGSRHSGEDPRAINQPVVWVHNRELISSEDKEGPHEFLYIVEVDESDPKLYVDAPFGRLMEQCGEDGLMSTTEPWRWYFYTGSLPVKEIRRWNGERYV